MKKSIIVIDLDETLSKINTFHAFIYHIIKQSFSTFNWYWLLKILFWSTLRTTKSITHKKWKYEIIKCSQNQKINLEEFVRRIHKTINPFVLNEIEKYDFSILATAAPSLYAAELAKKYLFTHYIATEFRSEYSQFSENIQEEKFNNVKKTLNYLSINKIDLFVTDHIDDALLVQFAQQSWLINADENLKHFINEHHLEERVKYIDLNAK